MTLSSARAVAAHLAVALPARLARWFDREEWRGRDGYVCLPLFAQPMWLGFADPSLSSFFDDAAEVQHPSSTEVDLERRWVPIGAIGSLELEAQFVAVDATTEGCAVSMYWPESKTWKPVAPSLDVLLESVGATPARAKAVVLEAPAEAQLAAVNEAQRVLARRASKARTAELLRLHARLVELSAHLTDRVPFDDGRFGRLGSGLVWRRAQVELALGLKREARVTLERLEVDGAPIAVEATLLELLLEFGEPGRVVELASREGDLSTIAKLALAAALVMTDQTPEAQRVLEDVMRRRANAAVKLSLGKKVFGVELEKTAASVESELQRLLAQAPGRTSLAQLVSQVKERAAR